MQKLSNPISIFLLIALGIFFLLFRVKFSEIFDIQSSTVFAVGIFFITFGLGLIFYNYLVTDFFYIENTENKILKTEKKSENLKLSEQNKPISSQVVQAKNEEIIKSIENNNPLTVQEKKEKEEEFVLSEVTQINKQKTLNLMQSLSDNLQKQHNLYLKRIFLSKFLTFLSIVLLGLIAFFAIKKYPSINQQTALLLISGTIFSFLMMWRAFTLKSVSKSKIHILSTRILNLNQTSKRFTSISEKNSMALKSTLNSLIKDNKKEIFTQIK